MILHPQAQGTLAIGIHDDVHTIDKERSEEAGRIGMERSLLGTTNWKAEADEWIRYHMNYRFTADDLITEIGLPTDYDPSTLSNNGVGAYLSHLARRNPPALVQVGFAKAFRVSSHGRILRIWRVVGRPW